MKQLLIGFGRIAVGVLLGLIVAYLLAKPLSLLPGLLGPWTLLVATIAAIYIGVLTSTYRLNELIALVDKYLHPAPDLAFEAVSTEHVGRILVDISAILDGRILQIGEAGWLMGKLLLTPVVLKAIGDDAESDSISRRRRGEYGLKVLKQLQRQAFIEFVDAKLQKDMPVDVYLIVLAKQLHAKLLTRDFQLTRSARLQGISVLNIDELERSVRPIFLPGERDYPQTPDIHIHFL